MDVGRFGNKKLMFLTENLEKRKCWDDLRGQMFFFFKNNNENKYKCKVRNLEQPSNFILEWDKYFSFVEL